MKSLVRYYRPLSISMLSLALVTSGCGSSSDSSQDSNNDDDGSTVNLQFDSTTETVGVALAAMGSLQLGPQPAALRLASATVEEDGEEVHPKDASCTINAEAYGETEGKLDAGHELFAQRTFHCQLSISDSPDAVLGSLMMNHRVLCDAEKAVGEALEFTEEGNEYSADFTMTAECGWPQSQIDEMDGTFPVVMTAKALTEGDWQQHLNIIVESLGFDFNIYINLSDGVLSFKQMENWTQEARLNDPTLSENDVNPIYADDAAGASGGVITVDFANGVLRAETIDNYWGRRTRLLAEGTIDQTTGEISAISNLEGLYAQYYLMGTHESPTGANGEFASVKGNATDGFQFRSAGYACSENEEDLSEEVCDASQGEMITKSTIHASSSYCEPGVSGTCDFEEAIDLGKTEADFDFLMIHEPLKQWSEVPEGVSEWVKTAGPLGFTTVTKDGVLD